MYYRYATVQFENSTKEYLYKLPTTLDSEIYAGKVLRITPGRETVPVVITNLFRTQEEAREYKGYHGPIKVLPLDRKEPVCAEQILDKYINQSHEKTMDLLRSISSRVSGMETKLHHMHEQQKQKEIGQPNYAKVRSDILNIFNSRTTKLHDEIIKTRNKLAALQAALEEPQTVEIIEDIEVKHTSPFWPLNKYETIGIVAATVLSLILIPIFAMSYPFDSPSQESGVRYREPEKVINITKSDDGNLLIDTSERRFVFDLENNKAYTLEAVFDDN